MGFASGCSTPQQYLAAERKALHKTEFVEGGLFPRPSATAAHVLITANVVAELSRQLRRRCRVYTSDMRVATPALSTYTYPDVSVSCEQPQYGDTVLDTLLNPCLIVEVLSPTTEAWDRGEKFRHYRAIPSLVHYLLISTERPLLELYTRGEAGIWTLSEASALEGTLALPSIDATLALADVYQWVTF